MAVKRIDLDLAPAGSISTAAKQEYAFDIQFNALAPEAIVYTFTKYSGGYVRNGKDLDFGQSGSGLPDVSQGVMNLFQPVNVGLISSTQQNGYTQTFVSRWVNTKGVRIQTPNNLVMTKTGERIWDSQDIYFLSDITLKADDLFIFQGIQYRVLVTEDWEDYGYNKYSVTQDYTKVDNTDPGVIA